MKEFWKQTQEVAVDDVVAMDNVVEVSEVVEESNLVTVGLQESYVMVE